MEGEVYVPLLVLTALLVGWYVHRYHRFKQKAKVVEPTTTDPDALDAHAELELQNLLQKAPLKQYRQIKILEDQGWSIQEWDDGRHPCFYMAPKGKFLAEAIILTNGQVIAHT